MFENIKADLQAALDKDPAARNKLEVILTYSGFKAIVKYRIAHWFHKKGWFLLARIISQRAKKRPA